LGSTPKRLGVPGESAYWSQGVYTCAVCDGAFYKNKVVAVAGGGDAALIEAQYLANVAAKVHVFVRGQAFRSVEQVRMQEILSHPKIQVHYGTIVAEVKGDGEKVTHVTLAQGEGRTSTLPVNALFLAIGSQPNSEAFAGQLALYPNGSIKLQNDQETSKPGVYAVGDITDGKYQQAVTAAGSAAKAAIQAQQYVGSIIAKQQKKESEKIASRTVVEIRSMKQFEHELSQSKDPVIVDFYSTKCGPCRTFAPTYDAWARRYGDRCTFLKVNADFAPEVFSKYSIRAVPTLLLLDPSGKMIRMSVGLGDIGAIEKHLESFQR
ncbi:MAG: FAD-dependent oxidoreductase, partial [Chlamydiota bacterium]